MPDHDSPAITISEPTVTIRFTKQELRNVLEAFQTVYGVGHGFAPIIFGTTPQDLTAKKLSDALDCFRFAPNPAYKQT